MVLILEVKEVFSAKNFVLPRQYTNDIVAIPLLLLKPFVFTATPVCVGQNLTSELTPRRSMPSFVARSSPLNN